MRVRVSKAVCLLFAAVFLLSGMYFEKIDTDFLYCRAQDSSCLQLHPFKVREESVCAIELLNSDCGGQTDFDGDISKKRELRIPHYLLDLGSRRSSDCELAVVLDVFCVLYQDPTGSVKAYIHETDGKKRA